MLTVLETQFMKQMPSELRHLSESIEKQTETLCSFLESKDKHLIATVSGSTGADGLRQTREDVIDIKCDLSALIRKAQCRQVNSDIIDNLDCVMKALRHIESDLTDLIGD